MEMEAKPSTSSEKNNNENNNKSVLQETKQTFEGKKRKKKKKRTYRRRSVDELEMKINRERQRGELQKAERLSIRGLKSGRGSGEGMGEIFRKFGEGKRREGDARTSTPNCIED